MEDLRKYCDKECKDKCSQCKMYSIIEKSYWCWYDCASGVATMSGSIPETSENVKLRDNDVFYYNPPNGNLVLKGEFVDGN